MSTPTTNPTSLELLREAQAVLESFKADTFANGKISGRSQREGEDLLCKIKAIADQPEAPTERPGEEYVTSSEERALSASIVAQAIATPPASDTPMTDMVSRNIARLATQWKGKEIDASEFAREAGIEMDKLATLERSLTAATSHINSAAQIADALNEASTRVLGMIEAEKVSFQSFAAREATSINLRQIVEMADELRNPGSTKWGTPNSQAHHKSAQAELARLRSTLPPEATRIIAAARKHNDAILTAAHHHLINWQAGCAGFKCNGEEGFMGDNGQFIDRVTARAVAEKAGQIRFPLPHKPKKLFSEELWSYADWAAGKGLTAQSSLAIEPTLPPDDGWIEGAGMDISVHFLGTDTKAANISAIIRRHYHSAKGGNASPPATVGEDKWENRTRWLMEQASYTGGGNGGLFTISFSTPLDSECDIEQLDAAMSSTGRESMPK